MAPEVLCIGHAAYDVGVFVEHFPEENSKCETRELIESGGGPAANAAWLLSHWGVGCAFAGVVGDDLYGQRIRDDFLKVGTDVSQLELRAVHATPLSLILINKKNGSRTIVNRKLPGKSLQIRAADMAPKVLLFDGHEPEASLQALRDFPDAVSILDAGSWREGTATLAGKVDFLAASERFAKQATGMKELDDEEARRTCVAELRKKYQTKVVVTLGEHGMLFDDGSGFHHLPAFPAQAVDTTAAGDIFYGAFAYGALQKWALEESLRFAAMTASLSVRKPGGRDSIPTLNQVKEALAMLDEPTFANTSLCVVGNINRDVKTAPLQAGEHLFSDGETSTTFIGETIGGGGANSAFAAAALGAFVTFGGKVGADGLGDRLERTLLRHGISSCLARDPEHPSGTSIALSFDNGHRHFVSCLPANAALTFADLDLKELSTCGHLLRADVWFSESMLFGGNAELFLAAQRAGVPVSLDLNWDPQWGYASAGKIRDRKAALRAVLPKVSLAHGNVRELMEFSDAPDLDTALKRLADWGVGAVVAHLGAQGAGYYQSGKLTVEPPVPVRRQVHTTGTGDVLSVCMMLLSQRADMTPTESLRTANAVVARFMEGALTLIPPLED